MAETLSFRQACGKWLNMAVSALITVGAVGVIFDKSSQLFTYGTAALSTASLVLNAYFKNMDPGALAQRHREAASDIWNIREAYLSLIADTFDDSIPLDQLRGRRDKLQASLHKIYHGAPHTNGKAYGKAQDALKNNEDLTFSENELDQMLPDSLRRVSRPFSAAVTAETSEGTAAGPTGDTRS